MNQKFLIRREKANALRAKPTLGGSFALDAQPLPRCANIELELLILSVRFVLTGDRDVAHISFEILDLGLFAGYG